MKERLTELLQNYLGENNPELLLGMENKAAVTGYLNNKLSTVTHLLLRKGIPDYVMEAECMELLTADLKPSKYNYITAVLEEDFFPDYVLFQRLGVLQFEVINIVEYCTSTFIDLRFDEDDHFLRYPVISAVNEYLHSKAENETVSNELQSYREISG